MIGFETDCWNSWVGGRKEDKVREQIARVFESWVRWKNQERGGRGRRRMIGFETDCWSSWVGGRKEDKVREQIAMEMATKNYAYLGLGCGGKTKQEEEKENRRSEKQTARKEIPKDCVHSRNGFSAHMYMYLKTH